MTGSLKLYNVINIKKIATILLLFIISNVGYSQLKPLTKKELKHLIREGIKAKKENYKDSWVICNKDSAFYKNDTLYLHGSISNTSHIKDCCEYKAWNFTTRINFYQTSINTCSEPCLGKVLTEADFFKIKIMSNNNKLLLQRYNRGKLIDSYDILGYTEKSYIRNEKTYIITLVRQKQD